MKTDGWRHTFELLIIDNVLAIDGHLCILFSFSCFVLFFFLQITDPHFPFVSWHSSALPSFTVFPF